MLCRKVSIGDWTPKPNECHANVNALCARDPQLKAIHGWMIVSEDDTGRCLFEAHSVIEDAGELYDITLQDQAVCDAIRFLPHVGTEDKFWQIERVCRQTIYPFVRLREMENGASDDGIDDDEPAV